MSTDGMTIEEMPIHKMTLDMTPGSLLPVDMTSIDEMTIVLMPVDKMIADMMRGNGMTADISIDEMTVEM